MIGGAAALTAIDAIFAESVLYVGAGLQDGGATIKVIWSNVAAPTFTGGGATARSVSVEVRKALLPERPAKADRITRGGLVWKPIDVVDLDEIDRWSIVAERA